MSDPDVKNFARVQRRRLRRQRAAENDRRIAETLEYYRQLGTLFEAPKPVVETPRRHWFFGKR